MSLKRRFILTYGFGGLFFLLVITLLVFGRMESAMVHQLEQQFKNDATSRISGLNRTLAEYTDNFKSTAELPMFRSMRFHKLTLNQAALKNDIRQMELYALDIIKQSDELTQIVYINDERSEIFRVDRSGIKRNLSDRTQDKNIEMMLRLADGKHHITQDATHNIIWWVPVYVSHDKIDGVLGFSVSYKYIQDTIKKQLVSNHGKICLINEANIDLLNAGDLKECVTSDDYWAVADRLDLAGLSWSVSLSVDPDMFLGDVQNIRMFVFGVIFPLVSILAFSFVLIFSNQIVRSIRQLVDAAHTIGRGDTLSPFVLNRDDELGELAKEINRTAALVEEKRDELEKINLKILEKSRRDLQKIMNHAPAVIYVKDFNGKYSFVNHQFEKIFHIKSEDIIGKTDHDLFEKEIADKFRDHDRLVIDTNRVVEKEEVAPHEDGLHSYLTIKFPLVDENDDAYAVCGISSDITDMKQHEEQLRRSQKMDALGKLTGGIAHDYNNMLGIVLGFSQLLELELSDNKKLLNYVHEIIHAGERGTRLTKKLLSFSKVSSIEEVSIDINALILEEQVMLEKTLTARINLEFELQDDIWIVNLNSDELIDTIVNLSINAMHAMPSGGTLTFKTRNECLSEYDANLLGVESGEYVQLSVIDTGGGMDTVMLQKIFDPFFTSKGSKGTGLGLSQVYTFVEHSGGVINVYSELDKGSRFVLYFPRSKKLDENVEQIKKLHDDKLKGSEVVLVVDDELALVGLTTEILSKHGYRVIGVNNGNQALEVLKNQHVDIMLSDIIMPEMDGYQLAAIVRKKHPAVKIQLISGYSDDEHIKMVDDQLQQNIIYKPFKSAFLLQKIRFLLDDEPSHIH